MDKLIFISNDDGFDAEGVKQLAEMVRPMGDVFVVAPTGGRSGASMSITSTTPVRNKPISFTPAEDGKGSVTVWSCSGTPDDCVKMAFEKLLPRCPDIVLGGINHGDNCAVNAHYSGTMAVALEGCVKRVPSVAFSSAFMDANADFSYMKDAVQKVVKMVLRDGLPDGICLNVNAPATKDIKGIKVCKMGMGEWKEEWIEKDHPRGGKYYWIAGYYEPFNKDDKDSDSWAFENGYVAVTPIQLDLTAYQMIDKLRTELE